MDPATIESAKRGYRPAQAQLLRDLQDPWYRMCLSLLGNVELAREATQETALRFLRQLAAFRGESHIRTWSLGIAINVAREMRRKRPPVAPPLKLAEPEPHAAAEAGEWNERLHEVLNDLPQRQREAVVLRFFEGLSIEETALAMDCAGGTVKATIHQALRSLRERLKQLA